MELVLGNGDPFQNYTSAIQRRVAAVAGTSSLIFLSPFDSPSWFCVFDHFNFLGDVRFIVSALLSSGNR